MTDKRLNTRVDVQWRLTPSNLDPIIRRSRLLTAIANWCQRTAKIGSPVYVWCREVGLGGHEHLHLAIHVPGAMFAAFKAVVTRAVADDHNPDLPIARYPNDGTAVHVHQLGTRDIDIKVGVESYFLKEGCPKVLNQWVTEEHRERATGGVILGKRIGVSQAIGRTAIKRNRGGDSKVALGSDEIPPDPQGMSGKRRRASSTPIPLEALRTL